jgi:ADP-ribosylglycohydrolase
MISESINVNRIKGLIFGQAVGDALGLSTEFLSKRDVSLVYKNSNITYDNILQDEHRKMWKKGEWTDDTDMCIIIFKHLLNSKDFQVDEKILAKDLKYWYLNGLKIDENYTKPSCGIGRNIGRVLNDIEFLNNPKLSSLIISLNCPSNGAVMRSSFISLFPNYINNTINSCKITHYSEDCVISCLFLVILLKKILENDVIDDDDKGIDSKIDEVLLFIEELKYDTEELKKYINVKSLDELKLNENIGYTYKPLGCAIYALKNYNNSFYDTLQNIIKEGGDADTNCCVAGSLLGSYIGYDKIEKFLIDGLHNKIFLDNLFLLYNKIILMKKNEIPEFGWNSNSKLVVTPQEVSKHFNHIKKNDMIDIVYNYTVNSYDLRKQPEKMEKLNELILSAPMLEKAYTVYNMSSPDCRISILKHNNIIGFEDDVNENLKKGDIFMQNIDYRYSSILSVTYDKSYPLSPFTRDFSSLREDYMEALNDNINEMSFISIKKYINKNENLFNVYNDICVKINNDENILTVLNKEYSDGEFSISDLFRESKQNKNLRLLIREMKKILIDIYYVDICCCCLFKIKIRNKRGLLIGNVSQYPDQCEMLLPNSTIFRVTQVYRTTYGVAITPFNNYNSTENISIGNKNFKRYNKLPNEMDYMIKNITVYEIETIN